jgi:sigma-B regulation protein RsbU (phosphoserine phosphatase)
MPPLVISPAGLTELPKGNAALGLSPDSEYAVQEVTCVSGQSFVVYSDGLTDAQSESGEFFGLERFKQLCTQLSGVSAQSFGEQVIAAVTRFEGDARRKDDLSLVILQKSA